MALSAAALAEQIKRNITRPYDSAVEFWSRLLGEVFSHIRERMNLTDVMPIVTVSGPEALPDQDCTVLVDTYTTPAFLALPASPEMGRQYVIKDRSGNAGGNPITIASTLPYETIEGSASRAISADYGSIRLLFTGSTWLVM